MATLLEVNNILVNAISFGNIEIAKAQFFINPNTGRNTPLYFACKYDNFELVKFFTEQGVDVDKGDMLPICYAFINENLEIIKYLVPKCTKINYVIDGMYNKSLDVLKCVVENSSIVDKQKLLLCTITLINTFPKKRKEIMEKIKYLVEDSGAVVNNEIIHRVKDVQIFRYFVSKGADINAVDSYGDSSLKNAIMNNNLELVQTLVELGANMCICIASNASIASQLEIVKTLLSNEITIHNYNCHDDFRYNFGIIIKYAIKNNIEFNVELPNNDTFLHVVNDNILVKYFINNGLDVNARNFLGKTPLFNAVTNGNRWVIRTLIDNGSDTNVIANDGTSLLHCACDVTSSYNVSYGGKNILTLLIKE